MNRTLVRVVLVSVLCVLLGSPMAWGRARKTITVRRGHPAGDVGRLSAAISTSATPRNLPVLRFGAGLTQAFVFRLDLSDFRLPGSRQNDPSSAKTGAR